mgnify:CR=1 FL=1
MKLLFRLLKKNISALQLAAFLVVSLLGGVVVLTGVQAYRNFSAIAGGNNPLSGLVVINKKLPADAAFSSLMGVTPSFSDAEVDELLASTSVSSVGRFVSAGFEVSAVLSIAQARMSTDIFLEALPDEFIEGRYMPIGNNSRRWEAHIDSETVPVIIPRSYLNLYNFGYAASNGLPQLSDKVVPYLPLKFIVNTANGKVVHDAVVCGLTDDFNTILVPLDFLNEANALYAPGKSVKPSRLALATDSGEFGEEMFSFLADRGYLIEGNSLQPRLQNFVSGILYIIIGIGTLFSLLAFFMFVMSIELLIERNRGVISNLYSLGYSVAQIARPYILMALVADVVVWVLAAVAASLLYPTVQGVADVLDLGAGAVTMAGVWCAALLFTLFFTALHSVMINKNVRRLCR